MTPAASDPWAEVAAARLPAADLDALGPVRDRADVRVHPEGDRAWVTWTSSRREVVACLLPVPGVEFFTRRQHQWFPFRRRLPAADRPTGGEGLPLAGQILPERLHPAPPPGEALRKLPIDIVRGGEPKPVAALGCRLSDLNGWADSATTAELASVSAARCGGRVLLRGKNLPAVPAARRYWGDRLLVPVGFRPEPELPVALLRGAALADDDELVILDEDGVDVVPDSAFHPLTRAGLRLALLEAARAGGGR
jgi:hypothetical protein